MRLLRMPECRRAFHEALQAGGRRLRLEKQPTRLLAKGFGTASVVDLSVDLTYTYIMYDVFHVYYDVCCF